MDLYRLINSLSKMTNAYYAVAGLEDHRITAIFMEGREEATRLIREETEKIHKRAMDEEISRYYERLDRRGGYSGD